MRKSVILAASLFLLIGYPQASLSDDYSVDNAAIAEAKFDKVAGSDEPVKKSDLSTADKSNSGEDKFNMDRSHDTHAIDEFPDFNNKSKEPEEVAEEQLKQDLGAEAEDSKEPKTSGKVLVNQNDKSKVASEATHIKSEDDASAKCPKISHRPSVALALGGGGARGTAHIGILRALKEAGIPIDYIVGNSMGSIIGGLYSAGVPLDKIQTMMLDDSLRSSYQPGGIPPKILISPLAKLMHPFKKHYAGLWTGKKFSEFLESQLPPNVVNVEDTPIPFSAVATNLIDGKAYRISNGKLSTAIRASSTIPPLLQPVAIDNKVFIDGGVRANLPASAAKDTGADLVIAVLVDEPLKSVPAKKFRHIGGIAERMGDIVLAIADARQLPFADVVINPDVSGLPVMTANPDDARKAIHAGEIAARKAIPEIQKKYAALMKAKSLATRDADKTR